MTVTVTTATALRAALDVVRKERVDQAIVRAQTRITAYCFEQWESGKATWSPGQPNDFWSGQYRASVNVSVGAPDTSYEPGNPGSWPIHENPYPPKDAYDIAGALAALPPYRAVYLANNVPYAQDVEAHTQIAHAAAAFTEAHFQGYDWAGQLENQDIPF